MIDRYAEQHRQFIASDVASAPESINALRRKGLARFQALGYPTTKNEDWHFTRVAPIAEEEFTFVGARTGDVSPEDLEPYLFSGDWHTAVFVNGRFAPELSSLSRLEGVLVTSLADSWADPRSPRAQLGTVLPDDSAFTALNTAFLTDGALVVVPKHVEVQTPIHLLFVTDANAAKTIMCPRNFIVMNHHARATIVESYVSLGDAMYFTNAVTEVRVGNEASLSHYKVQREARRAFHVGSISAEQASGSHYTSFSFATGGSLTRTNIYTKLDGAGSGATLNGLYMLDNEQHCDHQTRIEHVEPNCFSREVYKGVLDGRSHGVFNGKVYVHPAAQKTDGKQTNNTLLLSKEAQIDTKPQLEIFADDVKCTHGATVGRLDEVAWFYMKSRGMNAEVARRLLIYAFAADVLETIEQAEVRETLERVTLERFVAAEELVAVVQP